MDPSNADPSTGPLDPRVVAALEEFLALMQGPCPADRDAFLADRPEIAAALAPCLDGLEVFRPAGPDLGDPEESLPASTHLGEFRIIRLLGRGGMGVVYEALQLPLGRRVALKVLPSAAALDPLRRQRFQVEAQAAAQLRHPHIVPVFAVGSDQGANFYAMQFIDGRTLADAIRDMQRGRDEGDGPSSFRAVARWGMQAAGALEHAHGLGVLHRDIKPANLIIDSQGELWVTDFGLARLQGEGDLTRTGDVVGTLRYMSPEQSRGVRGAVDRRTDVYSLGTTLYELLTLRPAFDADDREGLLRRVAEGRPPSPRSVDPTIPRDLETIVLKCMATDPSHRYPTAGGLAEDLRRYLDDEPIRARRPTPLERAARWARRHRTAVVAAAVAAILIGALGSAVLGLAYQRARANNERARQALRRTFAITDALSSDAMARLGTFEQDPRGGQFFIGALGYYEQIAGLYSDDPEMREMAAAANHRIGSMRALLRHVRKEPAFLAVEPEIPYRLAVDLYDAEIAARPDDADLLAAFLGTLSDFAALQNLTWRYDDAERTWRRIVAIRRTLSGPGDDSQLAHALAMHGQSLELAGRHREALDAAREAEARWAALAGLASSDAPDRHAEIVEVGNQVGLVLSNFAPDRADRVIARARELDPDEPSLLNNEAWQLVKRPGATAEQARRAVNLSRRASEAAPGRWELWNTLGIAHLRAGSPAAAVEALRRASTLHLDGDAADGFPLAMALWQSGDRNEARAAYDRAVRWIGRHPERLDLDLMGLHCEAAGLLGMPAAEALRGALREIEGGAAVGPLP